MNELCRVGRVPPSGVLAEGEHEVFGSATSNLVIIGLLPARTFDLYLASYSAYNGGTFKMRFMTSNTTLTTSPQTVTGTPADGSTWAQGANYARFASMTPDVTGNITVGMAGYSFLNGFQLVGTSPQAITKTCTFSNYGAATILGSSIAFKGLCSGTPLAMPTRIMMGYPTPIRTSSTSGRRSRFAPPRPAPNFSSASKQPPDEPAVSKHIRGGIPAEKPMMKIRFRLQAIS